MNELCFGATNKSDTSDWASGDNSVEVSEQLATGDLGLRAPFVLAPVARSAKRDR